jgi:hypothetical protein
VVISDVAAMAKKINICFILNFKWGDPTLNIPQDNAGVLDKIFVCVRSRDIVVSDATTCFFPVTAMIQRAAVLM